MLHPQVLHMNLLVSLDVFELVDVLPFHGANGLLQGGVPLHAQLELGAHLLQDQLVLVDNLDELLLIHNFLIISAGLVLPKIGRALALIDEEELGFPWRGAGRPLWQLVATLEGGQFDVLGWLLLARRISYEVFLMLMRV